MNVSGTDSKIKGVESSNENLTGRGGLSLFSQYLDNINIFELLFPKFKDIRKNNKGLPVNEAFKQIFCFFVDGTSSHLSYFDQLFIDPAYGPLIGIDSEDKASSHAIKRFFNGFTVMHTNQFTSINKSIFLWRLNITNPDIIILDLDAMVLDNDQAIKRKGVNTTYKNVKGFNALQMTWEGLIIDTIFRSGEKHSNYGTSVEEMIREQVEFIRKNYKEDVPIILHLDSGFMDQKVFDAFEKLQIGYLCGGKLYEDITTAAASFPHNEWNRYYGPGEIDKSNIWEYVEFGDRRSCWTKFRRTIFTRPMTQDGQFIIHFLRPCTVIYTNLGQGYAIDAQLYKTDNSWLITADGVIYCYHDRGRSELTFRALKDFGDEKLPFKNFTPNKAFYYCMVLTFNLYQAFKEDVCKEIVPLTCYPTTLRRKVIDIGAKVVVKSRGFVLKVNEVIFNNLSFDKLWSLCSNPPLIINR